MAENTSSAEFKSTNVVEFLTCELYDRWIYCRQLSLLVEHFKFGKVAQSAYGSYRVRWVCVLCVCVCVCMCVCVYVCVYVCVGRWRSRPMAAAESGVCLCMYIYVCVYVYFCVFNPLFYTCINPLSPLYFSPVSPDPPLFLSSLLSPLSSLLSLLSLIVTLFDRIVDLHNFQFVLMHLNAGKKTVE
jgi:hypothetical protein